VPDALQEPSTPQEPIEQPLDAGVGQEVLQDVFFMQSTVFIGLIAHLSGLSFQDDIEATTRKLQQLGRDMLYGATNQPGGMQDVPTPHLFGQPPQSPHTMQLGRSAPGP
jgi:hypothetical protein